MIPGDGIAYLDWNATTPPAPEVVAAMSEALERGWANPASVHGPGRAARSYVEGAREAIGRLLGFDARDVLLTSGGTEANNLALMHTLAGKTKGKPGLVVSGIEHPSVLRTAELLAERGAEVIVVPPDPSGRVEVEGFARAIERLAGRLRLVSLIAVSHETGMVQPVGQVAELAHSAGALLHSDVVQAAGKVGPSVWSGADLVSLAAHKMRGPKGIGALATRVGVRLGPILRGGAQEKGVRPGTQDPATCAGFGVAARRAVDLPDRYAAIAPLRDRLERKLVELGGQVNGAGERAPHVTNVSFDGERGAELVAALDLEGVAVSSGSACSAGTPDPSPVIEAMVGRIRAEGALRFSLGDTTSEAEVDRALGALEKILSRGR